MRRNARVLTHITTDPGCRSSYFVFSFDFEFLLHVPCNSKVLFLKLESIILPSCLPRATIFSNFWTKINTLATAFCVMRKYLDVDLSALVVSKQLRYSKYVLSFFFPVFIIPGVKCFYWRLQFRFLN